MSKIEWCDETWNPIIGCSPVSAGCANCYAARFATRHAGNPMTPDYHTITIGAPNCDFCTGGEPHVSCLVNGGKWTGQVRLLRDRIEQPLHWRKPRRVFVCSMGDLFHEAIPYAWINSVIEVIGCSTCAHHTFMLLTKRPHRVLRYFNRTVRNGHTWRDGHTVSLPPNVMLGVSVEDQLTTDVRIPLLLQTPAARRFVSLEPMLGPVDIERHLALIDLNGEPFAPRCDEGGMLKLGLVILGAEQGPGARPMNLDWARSVRDQCAEAGVPFFFKKDSSGSHELDGRVHEEWPR